MLKSIDNWLNGITMYRLALYYLIFLLAAAVGLSAVGLLAYDPFALLFTTGFLAAVCAFANWVFSKSFGAPANAESAYISALILALIIAPLQSYADLWFLGWAAVLAMSSKYIVAFNRKHIFNPIAFAVALTYFAVNQSASWWVGDAPMLPFVVIGGVLLVRKIRRGDLALSFLLAALVTITGVSLISGADLWAALARTTLYSPLFFFAFVILTEPLTTPPSQSWRIAYGVLVGVLFTPQFHLGAFYTTPELAILLGNLLAFAVGSRATLILRLKQKIQIAPDVYDFVFALNRPLAFRPGQYMEWTLGHADPDTRGNRRYFTLASAPGESEVRLGVKFYRQSSTFKRALLALKPGAEIAATNLAGDFVLPRDPEQKCVFIAGGIGITPFRSMLQYLVDKQERRPIVVFYATKSPAEMVYTDVLEKARRLLGVKTVYTITAGGKSPAGWTGRVGHITPQMIRAEVPDYARCVFYISGPPAMVNSFQRLLNQLHIPGAQIRTDFFSGLA